MQRSRVLLKCSSCFLEHALWELACTSPSLARAVCVRELLCVTGDMKPPPRAAPADFYHDWKPTILSSLWINATLSRMKIGNSTSATHEICPQLLSLSKRSNICLLCHTKINACWLFKHFADLAWFLQERSTAAGAVVWRDLTHWNGKWDQRFFKLLCVFMMDPVGAVMCCRPWQEDSSSRSV